MQQNEVSENDSVAKSTDALSVNNNTLAPSSLRDKLSKNLLINSKDISEKEVKRRVLRSSSLSTFLVPKPPNQTSKQSDILEGSIARLWVRSAPSSPSHVGSSDASPVEAFKVFHPRLRSDKEYYCLPPDLGDNSSFSSLLQPQSVDRFVYKIMRRSNVIDRQKPVAPVVPVSFNAGDLAQAQFSKPPNLQTNSFLTPKSITVAASSSNANNASAGGNQTENGLTRVQTQVHANSFPKRFVHSISTPSFSNQLAKHPSAALIQALVNDTSSSSVDGALLRQSLINGEKVGNGNGDSINLIAEKLRNQCHLNVGQITVPRSHPVVEIPLTVITPLKTIDVNMHDAISKPSTTKTNPTRPVTVTKQLSISDGNAIDKQQQQSVFDNRSITTSNSKIAVEKKPQSLHRSSSAAVIRLHVDKPPLATTGAGSLSTTVAMPSVSETHGIQLTTRSSSSNGTISSPMTPVDMLPSNRSVPDLALPSTLSQEAHNALLTMTTSNESTRRLPDADGLQQKHLGLPPRPPTVTKNTRDAGSHFKPPKPSQAYAATVNGTITASPRSGQQKTGDAIHRSVSAIGLSGGSRPLPQLKPQLSQGNLSTAKNGTSAKKSPSETTSDDESPIQSEFDRQDTESSSGFVDVDEDDIIDKISDDENLSDWDDDDSGAGSRPSSRSRSRSRTSDGEHAKRARSVSIPRTSSQSDLAPQALLTDSLFPNVPPTVNFVDVGQKVERPSSAVRKLLKWRLCSITPNVVKHCLTRSHFHLSKKGSWIGYWGKHMKPEGFKDILDYQKINHFPGSFQIGRKDRLWKNLSHMQAIHGKKEYNFFPLTFILPADLKLLKQAWDDNSKKKWIMKPPASARGNGIHVIHKWNQVPKKRSVIIQKYLAKPYLINDSKFDMRIYVYVTSFDPLRIYIFRDGLARFASCKYSSSLKSLSNRYMHMTNYSVNKRNPEYESNSDETVCQGHKWSLKALWAYMRQSNVNTAEIWNKIKDLVIKTIISCESNVNSMVKAHVRNRLSCHELFGFDVILDENLKPWILEVNISPSLHSDSSLDITVKGEMIKDLFNIVGFRLPQRSSSSHDDDRKCLKGLCMDKRILPGQCSPDERAKHAFYVQHHSEEHIMNTILNILTPDDIRVLVETVDEESRSGGYELIFPSAGSHRYLEFMEQPRYYNLLLDAWLQKYHSFSSTDGCSLLETLTAEGIHLQNPTDCPKHQWSAAAALSGTHMMSAQPNARARTGRTKVKQATSLVSKSAGILANGDKSS